MQQCYFSVYISMKKNALYIWIFKLCINGRKRYLENPDKFIEMMKSNRKVGDEKRKIKIIQIDNNTGEIIKTWDSAADVERVLGINHSNVTACCRGKVKTAGGFKWRYYD